MQEEEIVWLQKLVKEAARIVYSSYGAAYLEEIYANLSIERFQDKLKADFDYFCKMEYWSHDEALALLCGVNLDFFQEIIEVYYKPVMPYQRSNLQGAFRYHARILVIKRHKDLGMAWSSLFSEAFKKLDALLRF